jgi:hypothetical protein
MTFKLSIVCDNAAFDDGNAGSEIARILREVANELDGDDAEGYEKRLTDMNGNAVGTAKVTGRKI